MDKNEQRRMDKLHRPTIALEEAWAEIDRLTPKLLKGDEVLRVIAHMTTKMCARHPQARYTIEMNQPTWDKLKAFASETNLFILDMAIVENKPKICGVPVEINQGVGAGCVVHLRHKDLSDPYVPPLTEVWSAKHYQELT
jgi:hypothetical protein